MSNNFHIIDQQKKDNFDVFFCKVNDRILFKKSKMSKPSEVTRILKAKNLYDILGVDKNCSKEDIKRSYRKLALKIHPDRCKEEGTTEAFQHLSHAYQILSDTDKRRNYDLIGDGNNSSPEKPVYRGNNQFWDTKFYSVDDIDPDELFRAFFGNDFPDAFYSQPEMPRVSPEQVKTRMRLVIFALMFVLVVSLFPYLIRTIFSGDGFDLKKELTNMRPFDEIRSDDSDYKTLKSYRYREEFSVPYVWYNDLKYKIDDFDIKLRKCADKVFAKWIKEKCIENGSRGSYCVKMRSHNL